MSGIPEFIVGDTIFISWVESSQTVNSGDAFFTVFTGSETVVDSDFMVNSGPGLVANHTIPNTPGYYSVLTEIDIGGFPFRRKKRYQAICLEVD